MRVLIKNVQLIVKENNMLKRKCKAVYLMIIYRNLKESLKRDKVRVIDLIIYYK
jgi:hypothetical protein